MKKRFFLIIVSFFYVIIPTNQQQLKLLENLIDDLIDTFVKYTSRTSFNFNKTDRNYETKTNGIEGLGRIDKTFDFIVVGSGSSGSVIANRLSEIPHWNILLLEVGKKENALSQIPIIAPALQFSHYNWEYFMEYQDNMCLGLENNRMHWPRGRALGGTSVINYMIYTRGNKLDYDKWASQGNPGWSYEDILPYFIKSERTTIGNANSQYHGYDGYLTTEDVYQSQFVEAFIKGGNELHLPLIDYNSPIQSFGVSTVQATAFNGRRQSVAQAFLDPIEHRNNLKIITSAYVTKILIEPTTKQTYGVEYERHGIKYQVKATKEVIISAGTFNSPQLLMLAGIGPYDDLQALGIPVLQDLPVGRNLHDHLCYPGLSFLVNESVSVTPDKLIRPQTITNFLLNGTGPYTSLGGVEGIGYMKTEISQEIDPIPDIELIFVGGTLATDYGLITRKGMNIQDNIYNSVFQSIQTIPQWTIFPMLLHPKSIGYLKLRSTNPYDYPLLYGNYFTDPNDDDLNTFVASIRFIQTLSKTRAFQQFNTTLNTNHLPNCKLYKFDSDQYWKCALRSISVTLHHQVGTVKMGPKHDSSAVVNHELKVYGIERLRVADCSVIPFAIGAHTNAPAIMIGEKASDLIKYTWGEL